MPKPDPIPKRYLTQNEVCRYLSLSLQSVEKLRKTGQIRVVKLLSEYRFDIYDVDAFMSANKTDGCRERR